MPTEINLAYHDISTVRQLFQEYTTLLGVDLAFQHYEEELQNLPGDYALPRGRLCTAHCHGKLAGCIAMRPLDATRCEMKRLYVRPEFRGQGVGRALAQHIVAEAKKEGYQSILLDTFTFLAPSVSLYQSLGFTEIEPYCFNPLPDALFLRLTL